MLDEGTLPLSIELNQVEPGDILLYRTSKDTHPVQYFIMLMQVFFNEKGGHFDTTHAAICIANDDKGPVIAHIGPNGYTRHPVLEYDTRERAFLIFRLYNKSARETLALVAASDEHKHLLWKVLSAFGPLFRNARLDPKRDIPIEPKTIDTSTFCTQFVIKAMKIAAQQHNGYAYPHLRSASSPKSLEAWLHNSPEYQMLVYLGHEPYIALKEEIQIQLLHIQNPRIEKIYTEIVNKIESNTDKLNDLYKILLLLKIMLPILTVYTCESGVMTIARKRGIFARDIEAFPIEQVMARLGCPVTPR
jgi:hypothetical protein